MLANSRKNYNRPTLKSSQVPYMHMSRYEKIKELWRGHRDEITVVLIGLYNEKRIRHLRAWGIANCCLVFLYAGIITYECILSMSVERWFSAGLIFLYICAYSGSASVSMKTVSKIMMTWKSKENIPPYAHQNVVVFLVEIDTPLTPNTPSTMALPISQV
ncbi:unnamed protein product [Timema podura]|uniref:Uncharacterized protein n=1 Tax=Timema podura TaxID=61482 RepID=A0ABN7NVT1_TIMPD|nr:unnamed protein product [Timema podura]